jgi:hypothetical protein
MDGFLLDCCFNSDYEGLKFRESTPRYANRLCAMKHSAESRRFIYKFSNFHRNIAKVPLTMPVF